MSIISSDIRYALRALRRAPGFSLVAIITLALGIGANTAIFSVVNGILLRPLPFQDPDKLVMVASVYGGQRSPSSPANIVDWQAQNKSFTSMSVVGGHSAVLTGNGDPERLRGFDVSGDFFGILGVKPVLGRLVFTPEESSWQGPKAVLLNETVWRTRFGADSALVGKLITLDNERYLVAGIVPAVSAWPSAAVMWFPATYDPKTLAGSRGAVFLNTVARLKPGTTLAAAIADMRALMQRLDSQYPEMNTGVGVMVVPMPEWITGDLRRPLFILLGGVGFVLLIACANVANLLLVRGVAREGEFALRTALGAARGRLTRQLITESLVLSMGGGIAGLGIAVFGIQFLVSIAPSSIPRLRSIQMDATVLAFTLLVAVATGIVFGLVPARRLARPDVAKALREGTRGAGQRAGSHRARQSLVIAEMALSVMLLVGAGLLIRSFERLTAVDPGFRTENSISFALSLPDAKYGGPDNPAKRGQFVQALMERVHAIPGVRQSGAAFGMPLTNFFFSFAFEIAGRPPLKPTDQPVAELRIATPDYFSAMGIRIVKGRGFTDADRTGAPGALLITELAAHQFFPNEDPIGKHVTLGIGRNGHNLEGDIVGIVSDVKQGSLSEATLPQFWAPFDQWPMGQFNVIIHTARDPQAVVAEARRVVKELDPDLAMSQIKTLDQVVAESVAQPRFYMVLLALFAAVALALSAVGIYGVIAYVVGQRSREIGIRLALGATAGTVVGMIVREGAALTAVGLATGLAGALALTRLMSALLFGVTPTDAVTFGVVTAILAAVALTASCVPALRAARVDPALTMRAE